MRRMLARVAVLSSLAGLAAACQSGPGAVAVDSGRDADAVMHRVSRAAQQCWFRSKAPEFSSYRLADELNSYSGRPRFLLVPAHSPESRPLLVVQAEGNPARVEAFGPLMQGAAGKRIAGDVERWAAGSAGCS